MFEQGFGVTTASNFLDSDISGVNKEIPATRMESRRRPTSKSGMIRRGRWKGGRNI